MSSTNSTFIAKNGIIANGSLIYAVGGTSNVGINNTSPDAALTVTGTANVQGNVVIVGTANSGNHYVTGYLTTTTNVNTVNVYATTVNASANVITTNVYATTVNASSNVITTNVYATTVNASANVITTTTYISNAGVYASSNVIVNASGLIVANTTGAVLVGTIGTTQGFSANTTFLTLGNSSVNTQINTTHFFTGNSTSYGFGNSTYEANVTAAGGVNTSVYLINSSSANVGNSQYYGFGNSTVEGLYNTVANTSGVLTASNLNIGNSTANTFVNSTVIVASGNVTASNINAISNVNVGNILSVSGNATITGNVVINGSLNVNGPGGITASVSSASSFVPTTTSIYSLGSSSFLWQNVYAINFFGTNFNGTSNNSTYLNGQLASYYTSASNITTGTLPYAQIPANIVNTTGNFVLSGNTVHNANLVANATLFLGTSTIVYANGALGTTGQVLTTNATGGAYWSTVSGGGGSGTVTSITAANGLSGGTITTSGILNVIAANNTLFVNSSGVAVNAVTIGTINPGNWANATNGFGISGTANNALYLGGTPAASYLTTSSTYTGTLTSSQVTTALTFTPYNATNPNGYVNSTSGTANNSSYLGGVAAASYATQSYVTGNPINAANATNGFAINGTSANATLFAGYSWASPAALGGTTANSATFTTVTATSFTGSGAGLTGTASNLSVNNSVYFNGTTLLTVNTAITANAATAYSNAVTYVGTNPLSAANATNGFGISGSANNAAYLGTVVAASYQLNSTLAANVATLTSNNANYLGTVAAANYVNTSGSYTLSGNITFSNSQITGFLGNINTQTANYTLANTDTGKIVEMVNAGATIITLPNTTPQGFNCTIVQAGAGNVTFSNAAGTTFFHRSTGANTGGQWAMATLYVRSNAGGAAVLVLGGDTV